MWQHLWGQGRVILGEYGLPKTSKLHILTKIKSLWMWQHLWGQGRVILGEYGLWEMP